MASDRPQPLVTGSPAPGRLFTTWMTSTDGTDHAVTDEEFAAHRPEPEAVCGAVILLAPMEAPPGPRCPRCVAFLAARESLRDLPERLGEHRHRRPGWLERLFHGTMSPVVPRQRAGARHGRSEPPAEMTRPGLSAGPDHPAAARSDSTAAGPQPPAEDQARSSVGAQPPVETWPNLVSAGPQPLGTGEVGLGRHQGTAPAGMWRNLVPAGATKPPAEDQGRSSAGARAEAVPPTVPASAPITPESSGAVSPARVRPAPPPSPQEFGRRGTQSPAGAECSPAAAPAGHHQEAGE